MRNGTLATVRSLLGCFSKKCDPILEGCLYTSVDLMFKSVKKMSALPVFTDKYGVAMNSESGRGTIGAWQKFTCQIGKDELIGDEISGIIISYNHSAESKVFIAYFDDIIIEHGEGDGIPTAINNVNTMNEPRVFPVESGIKVVNVISNSQISVYNLAGQLISKINVTNSELQIPVKNGFYLISIKHNGNIRSEKVIVR